MVYQLALRIGASYEATCWTLVRHRFIQQAQARDLPQTQPRELKVALLEAHRPQDYRGDVWLLTERDAGARIDGSRNDLFVLRLEEHSGGGYLWDIDQLKASGFAIVRDDLEAVDGDGVGGSVIRRVTAAPRRVAHAVDRIDQMENRLQRIFVTVASLPELDEAGAGALGSRRMRSSMRKSRADVKVFFLARLTWNRLRISHLQAYK